MEHTLIMLRQYLLIMIASCILRWTEPCITDDSSRHCYEIVDTEITWKNASDLCKYDGGTLAIIESKEEQRFIQDLMEKRSFTAPGLWIGSDKLHPQEQRAWSNGENFSYSNWAPGEPNSMINEDCLELRTYDDKWNDVICTKHNMFICETEAMSLGAVRDYIQDNNTGRWYKIVYELNTWHDAFNICDKDGGTLLIIESPEEQKFIESQIRWNWLFLSRLWLGSNKVHPERNRKWTDGQKFTYVNWAEGEPNNYVENCAEIDTQNMMWSDQECTLLRGYICEKTQLKKPFIKDETSGHFYQTFNTKITWKNASDLCKHYGSNLVTIESIEEQTFITDLIKKRTFTVPGLWIGSDKLHLEERHAWANGEQISYVNWAPGEPNSHLIEENCLVIRTNDSTWMDVTCTETNGYICENSPAQQQSFFPNSIYGGLGVARIIQDDNTGHWYKLVNSRITWDEAWNICDEDGGTLMIIESTEEQMFIAAYLQYAKPNVEGLWLGSNKLHPERTRTWRDGQKFTYVNWAEGEPNNSPYVENCAEMYTANGTWNDRECTLLRGVICEKMPEVTPYKLPEIYIIIISVGSALVIFVSVTIICCFLHKRNKSKKKQEDYQDVHNLEMNQAEHEYDRANENYYTIYDN